MADRIARAAAAPVLTVKDAATCAQRGVDQLVALLRQGGDPRARVTPEWTVRDVAAHLAGGLPHHVGIARGEGSPLGAISEIESFNAQTVADEPEGDLGVLAARIEAAVVDVIAAARDAEAATTVPWHGGIPIPLATAVVATAGETYVHGRDIARAWRVAFSIPAADARAIARGMVPLLPAFVDSDAAAGVRARILVRLRGVDGERWLLTFHDGSLSVTPPDGERVDCTIWADSVGFLLSSYSRIGLLGAGFSGQVLAWGRRPALAWRLSSYLATP